MLDEVEEVFTKKDNQMLLNIPNMEDVKDVVASSNQSAAPGSDRIPSLLYHKCWDIMGQPLTEVVEVIHKGDQPIKSMQTILMVFVS